MSTVDARGLSCPLPVMMTDEAVKASSSGDLVVLVDSGTAKTNVSSYLLDAGYTVDVHRSADGAYAVSATRAPGDAMV
jgi:tRNA 2-thiouridine synthesizing protein A